MTEGTNIYALGWYLFELSLRDYLFKVDISLSNLCFCLDLDGGIYLIMESHSTYYRMSNSFKRFKAKWKVFEMIGYYELLYNIVYDGIK